MIWRSGLVVVTLIAFGLRVHALGAVPLRWDEGWSIALASLAPADIIRLTALDVHPPLYYALLCPWLALGGAHELWTRLLSALAATAAVPLAAVAAAAWWAPPPRRLPTHGSTATPDPPPPATAARLPRGQCVGLGAAAYTAIAPAFVYYAGVTRMYALTTPLLGLAAWGLARWTAEASRSGAVLRSGQRYRPLVACIAGALAALLTFYYTGFALAGLFLAALVLRPRAWPRLLAAGLLVALLYLPWLLYAVPPLLARIGGKVGGGGLDPAGLAGPLRDGLFAALFAYRAGWIAVAVAGLVFALGLALAPRGMGRRIALCLTLLPLACVLGGAALGAAGHMFQPRYVIVATPFVALGLGWAVAGLWRRAPWLGSLAALALGLAVAPTFAGYVYTRAAEIDAAWDPAADWRALAPKTEPGDVVAFNILSLAGIYARYRTADDPPWTYAQLWDPVHEPVEQAQARLRAALPRAGRLWLVLYKGEVSPGSAALKAWADTALHPGEGWWAGETLYQSYVAAEADRRAASVGDPARGADFGHGVALIAAAHTSVVPAGGGLAVDLSWRASAVPDTNARVFVHAYGPDGQLVAQHDGYPVADRRPPKTWRPGEVIEDRHGLWIPPGTAGPLRLVVGLYDPATGRRWTLADGSDGVTIGEVEVTARNL